MLKKLFFLGFAFGIHLASVCNASGESNFIRPLIQQEQQPVIQQEQQPVIQQEQQPVGGGNTEALLVLEIQQRLTQMGERLALIEEEGDRIDEVLNQIEEEGKKEALCCQGNGFLGWFSQHRLVAGAVAALSVAGFATHAMHRRGNLRQMARDWLNAARNLGALLSARPNAIGRLG